MHRLIKENVIEVEKMKFILASDVTPERLEQFLEHNKQIELETLLKAGYVVERNDKIIGCFALEPIQDDAYWLKQLYVIRQEAVKLPIIVETVLAIAKQQQAKVIYAHSEQPVTDLLLESLCFSLQPSQEELVPAKNEKGHWWTYSISS